MKEVSDSGFNEFGNINTTSLGDYVPWPLWEQILGITYYASISFIGILGNIFVLYAAQKVKKQSSDQKTLLIIKYLALVDLLSSMFLYPNFIYFTAVKRFDSTPLYCKILGIGEIYFPTTSTFLVLMLVGVKVDMLRNPFHSLSSSNKWIHVGCILICIAGLIIPSAPFYNLATYIYCPKRMTCTFDFYPDWNLERSKFIFVTWAVVFCCVAPLLAITILSYYIIKKVRQSRQVKDGKNVVERKSSGKSVRVVLLVVLAYAVTWASFFIVFTIAFFYRTELIIPRSLLFWPKASLMTNNAVNPIVYIYSNVNIQRFLILRCLPKCIAEKTETYREYVKTKQNKIFSTTAAIHAAKEKKRKFSLSTRIASRRRNGNTSDSTTATTISTKLCVQEPKRESHKNFTEKSETIVNDSFEEHASVTTVAQEKAREHTKFKKYRSKSLCKLARMVSVEKNGLKKTDSCEDRPSFGSMYKDFMESQLESALEEEDGTQKDIEAELCNLDEAVCKL
ncbi:hypothetical protein ACHWQZ_G015568 [Mnemiopsis leidyi]